MMLLIQFSRFVRRILGAELFPLKPVVPEIEPQVYQPQLVPKQVLPPAPPPPP